MKKRHSISMLIAVLIIAVSTVVIAGPDGIMRHHEKPGFSPLSQIDLNSRQTEKIRKLRVSHEESITPLKLQEHQVKAELDIFWLQLSPDTQKIKFAQKKIHDIKFQILEKDTEFRIAMREVLSEDQLSRFLALGGNRRQGPNKFDHHPPHRQQPERY